MALTELLKQLKKRLLHRKRLLALGIWLIVAGTLFTTAWMYKHRVQHAVPAGLINTEATEVSIRVDPETVTNERQAVIDLLAKETVYFGVDEDGNLTLFEGTPDEKKSIRTFFQLNIGRLESSLPIGTVRHLQEGIRIQDIEEYNSVLSTFSFYAVEE